MLSPADVWIFFSDIFENTGADVKQEQKMLLVPEQVNCVSVCECN